MRIQDMNAMQDVTRFVGQAISTEPRTTTVWETLVAPTAQAMASKREDEVASSRDEEAPSESLIISDEAKKLHQTHEARRAGREQPSQQQSGPGAARGKRGGSGPITLGRTELLGYSADVYKAVKDSNNEAKAAASSPHNEEALTSRLYELMSASMEHR